MAGIPGLTAFGSEKVSQGANKRPADRQDVETHTDGSQKSQTSSSSCCDVAIQTCFLTHRRVLKKTSTYFKEGSSVVVEKTDEWEE